MSMRRKVTGGESTIGGGYSVFGNRTRREAKWLLSLECGHVVFRPRKKGQPAPGFVRECEVCAVREEPQGG